MPADPATPPASNVPAVSAESPVPPQPGDPGYLLPVPLRLPATAIDALDQLAVMGGRTRSALIRSILRAHLARYGLGDALPESYDKAPAKTQPSAATPPAD
jgi:hypothetical protein